MLSFIYKKLSKRSKHQRMISPSSRMLRTISIHHLECTDYVPRSKVGQKVTDNESSNVAFSCDSLAISKDEPLVLGQTQESVNGISSEGYRGIDAGDDLSGSDYKLDKIEKHLLYEHSVLKRNLFEARDVLLKQKGANTKGMTNEFAIQSKLLLDTLVLFNANRKALLGSTEDSEHISSDYVEILQSPTMFIKSASCTDAFVRSAGILFQSRKKGTKSESTSSFIDIAGASYSPEVLHSSHELKKRREAKTVVDPLSNLKQRINDVIMENRMEKHRISRDGILHRVPLGHNLLEYVKDKKLELGDDSASEKYDGGGEKSKFNNTQHGSYRRCAQKSFQQSRSLSETSSRYSQLFETLSSNEKVKVPERSKSVREDTGLQLPRNFGRMLSTLALRSHSFVQRVVHLESSEILSPETISCGREKFMGSISIQDDSDLQQGKLPKNFGRMLSSPVLRSYSFGEVLQGARNLELTNILTPEHLGCEIQKTVDKLNTDSITSPVLEKNDCEHEVIMQPHVPLSVEVAISSDIFVIPTKESTTEMVESKVFPVSIDHSKHHKVSPITEVIEEEADFVSRFETQTKAESDICSGKTSFLSSIDRDLEEGSASAAKDLRPKDSELPPICIDSDKQHQPSDADHNIDCNEYIFPEHSKPGYTNEQMAMDACDVGSLIHVDRKDDTVFEYVRYILNKCGDRVLHPETEVLSHELGADLPVSPFDQQLLLDLINEVLLEIYEKCTAPNRWLLHFRSKIRSMPKGSYLLEAVWAEISWHLHAPQDSNTTLDDLMAHAFAKNDGWLNLYRDAEGVALQLEHLIFDDLLDETVVYSDLIDYF